MRRKPGEWLALGNATDPFSCTVTFNPTNIKILQLLQIVLKMQKGKVCPKPNKICKTLISNCLMVCSDNPKKHKNLQYIKEPDFVLSQ
jgi:hypothetical protein